LGAVTTEISIQKATNGESFGVMYSGYYGTSSSKQQVKTFYDDSQL